ncbi:sugar ABC transporter permease, partial [Amylibacter sp.]|nr:sugar ABC transporter permease [Amylibacter sp.]
MTEQVNPPKGIGPMARREMRLAYAMLLPTFVIVLSIILFPLLANFWISFKPVQLADLRQAEIKINEQLRPKPTAAGEDVILRYRVRNSSQKDPVSDVFLRDTIPAGLIIGPVPEICNLNERELTCDLGDQEAGSRLEIKIPVMVEQYYLDTGIRPKDLPMQVSGSSTNVLTSFDFTLDN